MLAVVKAPHIEIRAEVIPQPVIAFFKALYGDVEVFAEESKLALKSVPWDSTSLYKKLQSDVKPSENLVTLRQTFQWTLEKLSQKTGIPAQNLSAMEKERRAITKETAERLALAFGTGPELFFFYSPSNMVATPKAKYSAAKCAKGKK